MKLHGAVIEEVLHRQLAHVGACKRHYSVGKMSATHEHMVHWELCHKMQAPCTARRLTQQDVQKKAEAEVEEALDRDDLGQDEPWVPDAGPVEH